MTTPKIYIGSTLVSGASELADEFPSDLLGDGVSAATSVRSTTTAVASATPHTPGSYVQIVASLSAASGGIILSLTSGVNVSATDSSTLLEIALGASGSEVVWATIGIGYLAASGTSGSTIRIPGYIPAGSRVSVRVRSAIASASMSGIFSFMAVKTVPPGSPVSMGVSTAASRGTVLTAPGSLNTKGAWTELVSATSAAFSNLLVIPGGASNTNMSASSVLIDVGIGTAGSEVPIVSDIHVVFASTESMIVRSLITFGVVIPSGSRLTARYARSNALNTADVLLVGA